MLVIIKNLNKVLGIVDKVILDMSLFQYPTGLARKQGHPVDWSNQMCKGKINIISRENK